MAKAPNKNSETPDAFSFPNMDAGPFADQFRSIAEQGLAKSKEAYESLKSSVEEAQKALEDTMATAQSHNSKLSLTAINAMRANTEAGFAFMEKLVGAKTLAEAFEIQSAYVRQQAELAVNQAKEMQSASKDAVDALSAPVKAATEKAMSSIKGA